MKILFYILLMLLFQRNTLGGFCHLKAKIFTMGQKDLNIVSAEKIRKLALVLSKKSLQEKKNLLPEEAIALSLKDLNSELRIFVLNELDKNPLKITPISSTDLQKIKITKGRVYWPRLSIEKSTEEIEDEILKEIINFLYKNSVRSFKDFHENNSKLIDIISELKEQGRLQTLNQDWPLIYWTGLKEIFTIIGPSFLEKVYLSNKQGQNIFLKSKITQGFYYLYSNATRVTIIYYSSTGLIAGTTLFFTLNEGIRFEESALQMDLKVSDEEVQVIENYIETFYKDDDSQLKILGKIAKGNEDLEALFQSLNQQCQKGSSDSEGPCVFVLEK